MNLTAYIALGSNVGDRRANLDGAIQALREHPKVNVQTVSSYHETEPVGGPLGQSAYLNAAAKIETDLSPEELLALLLDIERRFGRARGEANAPRTLDLDLLLYGDMVRPDADPILPHPRMARRAFVLLPLVEIAPKVVHPVLGQTIERLAEGVQPLPPPERPLAGLRTLITGSSSGIGLAIANAFADAGAWVFLHRRRRPPPNRLEVAARFIRERCGVPVEWSIADLRDPEKVSELAEYAWSVWGGLDVLVCNAGADTLTGEAAKWSFERKLEELWAVDVRSTIQLSRDIGARMKEQGSGLILTMGWDQAESGMEGESGQLFAAAKNAVMGFTRSLALSLAPQVRVNCLAPGWIRTAWGDKASAGWQERVRRETPLQRWGTPEDVAGVARWLASREARFITGQVIRINGGAVR